MEELAKITQHLLRSSPDALVVIDDRGQIRFANDTVTGLFGYTPEQLRGQPLDVLVPERLRLRHCQHITNFFREPRSREMGATVAELYARRADGTEFAAGIRLAPFKIGDRTLVAAAIRDTTERQRINQALVAAREEAVRANRAKSRFLATASHDLRQPLQTIKLLNAAMTRLVGPSELAELLKHQEQAIESTTRLLNALLDISRLESGAIEPQCSNVALPEVLNELRAEFDSIARARGLRLEVQPVTVTVVTDRALFYQLLQNLVANALKYTDRGSVSVICVRHPESLRIHVRDTGIGIPPDKLERIFDEYYQVDTHGTKRMGVGLGLAIVKEVARLLSFKVAITSTVGCCTEVTLDIPASHLAAPATDTVPVSVAVAAVNGVPATRVVLIEDNEGVRMATELFLRLEGYQVRTAASYAEAEALLPSLRNGDLIIADYHLDSSRTGLEVLEHARSVSGVEIPGVILSGDLATVVRSLQAPVAATRFLSKPVDTNALLEAIRELSAA
jgi:two-component system, sensor histidine kinase